MSEFVVVMQAKKKLYFMPLDDKNIPMPFMLKGDLRIMRGKEIARPGYYPIEHNEENFRFFVPVDMLKVKL